MIMLAIFQCHLLVKACKDIAVR